jgi:hypothetical protein
MNNDAEKIQMIWHYQWMLFKLEHSDFNWSSGKSLGDYEYWIRDVYTLVRSQGYTARQWLRALRTLPNKDAWENDFVSFLYIPKI